ncbi:hypothetical protein [Massilia sp. METH4]|uniref:hypothetical protein n=1 Tax=Massilia sp. METH4 TaxID=3123041 RepID=UPI0030D1D4B8
MFNQISILALLLACSAGSTAAASKGCIGQVTDAPTAAQKADWIIEADVRVVALMSGNREPLFVVENTALVSEKVPAKLYRTATLPLDSCPHPSVVKLAQGGKVEGKRLRFYGSWHAVSPARRIFFVEPVESPLPQLPQPKQLEITGSTGEKPLGDGWHRAHSIDGGFSVDMPGPYVSATEGGAGARGAMLRSADSLGSTFMAVFEPFGTNASMFGTFDETIARPDCEKLDFKGRPAVYTRSVQPGGMIFHSMLVRIPGGTFMLGIVTSRKSEAKSMARKGRFFESLAID